MAKLKHREELNNGHYIGARTRNLYISSMLKILSKEDENNGRSIGWRIN